jgi:phage terminase small subunit
MPILKNLRWERFAQELASGKQQEAAYKAAGFKGDRRDASKLRRVPDVARRVDELLAGRNKREEQAAERAIERAAVTKERVIAELAKIGFANMFDYMKVGPDGDPHLDFSAITRDQAAALVEVTVEDFKDGRGEDARDVRRVKFKLADKKGALVDLGRELGMFITRSEQGKPGEFAALDDHALNERIVKEMKAKGISEAKVRAFLAARQSDNQPPM